MGQFSYIDTRVCNTVLLFDQFNWGRSTTKLTHMYLARRNALTQTLAELEPEEPLMKFDRRVTALSWHPRIPYLMSAACKGGAIVIWKGVKKNPEDEIDFNAEVISTGSGPGGAVFSIKFDQYSSTMYTASLTGKVERRDLVKGKRDVFIYDDTGNYETWYTGMDLNFSSSLLIACDNKGYASMYDIRSGERIEKLRLHKSKIHDCEFNGRDTNLLATAALDNSSAVCVWDIRKLKQSDTGVQPIRSFGDFRGANIASFNPDGSRLLTNDQSDMIKVYQGPTWEEILSIDHPHRQFQHLTGIEASWHPLYDVVIIGRYPKTEMKVKPVPPRPIEFFDGQTGELLHSLYHPVNGIVSLSRFNLKGDILATGMGHAVVLWRSKKKLDKLLKDIKVSGRKDKNRAFSKTMRNAIRGQAEGAESDDEDEIGKIKKSLANKRKRGRQKLETVATSTQPVTSSNLFQGISNSESKSKTTTQIAGHAQTLQTHKISTKNDPKGSTSCGSTKGKGPEKLSKNKASTASASQDADEQPGKRKSAVESKVKSVTKRKRK